jgi:hypothetical protein
MVYSIVTALGFIVSPEMLFNNVMKHFQTSLQSS